MFTGFFKKLRLITGKNHVVGQFVSRKNVSEDLSAFAPRNRIYLGNLNPFAFEKLQVRFPPGNGGNLIKSSSPQGNGKPLTFEENLLEEIAQELYLFSKMFEKK
jgi:hypothetical protein